MSEEDIEVQDDSSVAMQWQHKKHKFIFGLVILIVLIIVFML